MSQILALSFKDSFCGTLRSTCLHNPPGVCWGPSSAMLMGLGHDPTAIYASPYPTTTVHCMWTHFGTDTSWVSKALCISPEAGLPLHSMEAAPPTLGVGFLLCSVIPDDISQTLVFDFFHGKVRQVSTLSKEWRSDYPNTYLSDTKFALTTMQLQVPEWFCNTEHWDAGDPLETSNLFRAILYMSIFPPR